MVIIFLSILNFVFVLSFDFDFFSLELIAIVTAAKIDLQFLSNLTEYDRGDNFPFDFEPNGNQFGS